MSQALRSQAPADPREGRVRPAKIFNIHSLRGRTIAFTAVFIITTFLFSLVIYLQNKSTAKALSNVEELRIPFTLFVADIINGVNNAASAHRAYLLTGRKSYKQERLRIWKEEITPVLDTMLAMKDNVMNDSLKAKMETAAGLAQDYFQVQNFIDDYFENFNRISDVSRIPNNISRGELLQRISDRNQLNQEIYDKLKNEAAVARKNLTTVLKPLQHNQKQLLRSEIQHIMSRVEMSRITILLITMSVVLFAVSFSIVTIHRVQKSINTPKRLLQKLAMGELPNEAEKTQDELAEVIEAGNQLTMNIKNASLFAQNVGEGNFDSSFTPISEQDVLGNSLVQMRDRLQQVAEEERKRSWLTQGLAKFAEIIRSNNQDFKSLGHAVLEALINYLGANQGGLFIARDQSQQGVTTLDMVACYAYDRKKYLTREIKVHEEYAETLLGQVFLEKEKIYLTDLPADYIRITSGLGDAPPSNLMLIPLVVNDRSEGVLEIASFHRFDEMEIDFLEKICESISASVNSVKISERTQRLLQELQEQTEAMRAQEEEMRQNMEELTSTQEQMSQKQNELELLKAGLEAEVQTRTAELKESLVRFDLIHKSSSEGLWDMIVPENGFIDSHTEVSWSENFIKSLGFESEDELFSSRLSSWLTRLHPEDKQKAFDAFLAHLKDRTGETPFYDEHRLRTKTGEYRWFIGSCKTMRDEEGRAIRVAGYINDITPQKELALALGELKESKLIMEHKQNELTTLNEKMYNNEMVLRKAFEKMRLKETDSRKITTQLRNIEAQFRNLTQNIPAVIFQFEALISEN
ncbi:MAG: PAS domain-containing protein, partial [Bacteroidia bacterium]|nr:PAS domain-containing protein [Bacteroidia bacterium]